MKKLFKNKIFLIILIITIFKILITSFLPVYSNYARVYDDRLMLEEYISISNGEYLGDYNSRTLIKGILYPVFLNIVDISNIPYQIVFNLIYIISIVFLCFSLKDLFNNKKYLYILYCVLLFLPVSYSLNNYLTLYRNSLSVIFSLLYVSCLYNVYKNKSSKKIIGSSIFLGIVISLISLNREDTIWILPGLILLFILVLYNNKKYVILFLLPIIIIPFMGKTIVSYVNYKYYGNYTYNELTDSYFTHFYLSIMSIDSGEKIDRVSITREMLDIAFANSKTFSLLEDDIDKIYGMGRWTYKSEIENTNIIWAIRELVYYNFDYKSSKDINNFFKKIYFELEDSFSSNKIKRKILFGSVYLNPIGIRDVIPIINRFYYTINFSNSYYDMDIDIKDSIYNKELIAKATNTKVINNFDKNKYVNRIEILRNIKSIYSLLGIYLFIISIINYFYMFFRNRNNTFIVLTLLIISYITYIFGIAYNDVSSFDSINSHYLGLVYPIQCSFIVISLLSIDWRYLYEKGCSYFNALFKRRRKS
ncbi:MAG: hypothetical protein PHQ64_02480 [Bacilli bacterium]|nr:hypothetical protein [Bacilli bacterium]